MSTLNPKRIKPLYLHRLFLILLIPTLLLGACASASRMESDGGFAPPVEAPAAAPEPVAEEAEMGGSRGFGSTNSSIPPQQDVQRLVIKNASLDLVVDDPAESMDAIAVMAEEMGGFVVSANLSQTRLESGVEVPRASITVRVPAERLNEALDAIRAQSDREPQSERIESQDVTQEYTDLASRLRNLEAAEAQLTEIMESANRTEDVLSVYDQLVRVREEIEVIKGRMQYYEQSAALSAISVTLLANEAVQPLTVAGWQPVGVARDALQALINTGRFALTALIWIVIWVLPVMLMFYVIFVLPVTLGIKAWRRRRKAVTPPEAS